MDLTISEQTDAGIYEGTVDGVTVAGVVYGRDGDRVTLLATSVLPEYRGQGIAGRLLAGVLERLRDEGRTAILSCPFAADFVAAHPQYSDVVNGRGGRVGGARRRVDAEEEQ
jgi:predicted GNAT family acetyltransferase